MAFTENSASASPAPLSDVEKEQLAWTRAHYTKHEFPIPVRDGARLFTIVYAPKDGGPVPIMMKRTPYGIPPYGIDDYQASLGPTDLFAKEGFIFVYQDTRGRGMSDGVFQDIPPQNENPCDATDTYDTIQWLIEYLPHHNIRHNGKVGMWGVSYNGFTAGVSLIGSHEALKAVSPQAPTAEQGNGDDAYHNGCFCLAAEFNFYSTFTPRAGGPAPVLGWPPDFVYGTPDMYDFFLRMGPLSNANALYFKGANRFWNDILEHPNYDKWWQDRSLSGYMNKVTPAVLVVGGWFDAQDLAGPFALFDAIEKTGPAAFNTLVIGPWQHGRWYKDPGDTLGNLSFGMKTGEYYREHVELAFFKQHLKGEGEAGLPKALVFETGKNEWRRLDAWPPPGVTRSLYLREDGKLSFEAAHAPDSDEYTSDPARPVPVMPNFNTNPPFNLYMTEDQRFASKRTDVLVYSTGELEADITVAGAVEPVLKVSTSGTDSDFVVKLIDVYPNDYPDPDPNPGNVRRGGYQQLVRGEPFRGKFRNNPAAPEAFVPGEQAEIRFSMPPVYHTFRRGHRIMLHIQSSWFPLVDRNPQTFTDIPTAKPADFVKAVQKVHRGGADGSRIVFNLAGKVNEMSTLKKGFLKVATYTGFAPVCAKREKDGVLWGTDISFVTKFAEAQGLIVEFVPVDFKDIWLRPGRNECDMAAAGITPMADRVKAAVGAVWSNEYFHVQRSLLVREADKGRCIDDFAGKKIAVTLDSTADHDIQARPAKGAAVLRYSNDQELAVRDLIKGCIDAFGEGDVSNDYLARQNPGLAVIDRHNMVSTTPGEIEIFSFPVREESGIIGALNTWVKDKKKDYTDIPELKPA